MAYYGIKELYMSSNGRAFTMSQELLSIDQVAHHLALQARTVRGYVREGRLKAVRIGKQYRIAREDVVALTGHAMPLSEPVGRVRHVEVSSVVDVDAISADSASRVTAMLMAAVKSGGEGDQPVRVDTLYDEERGRLKIIVTGSLPTTVGLLKLITALTDRGP